MNSWMASYGNEKFTLITFKAPHLSVTCIAPIYQAKSFLYQAFLPKLSTGCRKSLGDYSHACVCACTHTHTHTRGRHHSDVMWRSGATVHPLLLSSAGVLGLSYSTFSVWCTVSVMTLSHDLEGSDSILVQTGNSGSIVTWCCLIRLY